MSTKGLTEQQWGTKSSSSSHFYRHYRLLHKQRIVYQRTVNCTLRLLTTWSLHGKKITNSCFPQNTQNSCLIVLIHLPTEAFNFECLTSQESWFPFRPFKSTSVISILFQQATLQLSLIEDRKDSVCLRWHDQKSSSRRVFISPVLDPKVWAFIVIQVLYFTR